MTPIEKMRLQAALNGLRGKSILATLCDGHSDAMYTVCMSTMSCTWQERTGKRQTRSETFLPLGGSESVGRGVVGGT